MSNGNSFSGGSLKYFCTLFFCYLLLSIYADAQQSPLQDTTKFRTVSAGAEYEKSSWHQFLWGSNYRKEWTTPVAVPVILLDTAKGGLKPYEAGGGHQTKSLHLKTANEKEYTLKIAQQLQKYLKRKKIKVFMTREQDIDLSMIDRTLMLRQQDPDFMISIHLNSSGNENVKGVSTYYRYIGFRPLSEKLLDRMLQLGLNNFGNVGAFNFALSGPTEYPNCLVEVAFLSNKEDEKKILDPKFHKAVAKKIYKGMNDWLKSMK